MEYHLGMEDVFLVYIDIDHIVLVPQLGLHVILNGIDAMVDIDFLAVDISGKSTDSIVGDDDIGFEGFQQEIQSIERGNLPAGGYIDVRTEGADAVLWVHLGVGMDGDMALVQVTNHILFLYLFFRDQHGDAGPLGVIVLLGNIQNIGTDGVRYLFQYLCEPFGAVHFIDIGDVLFSFLFCTGIADVVHVEAERFCQIIEAQ